MPAKQEPRDLLAEAVALLHGARMVTLATVANGVPHAALVTPALGPDAAPLLLLSTLAVHTRQLRAHPACALLLVGQAAGANPQTTPRLCLAGQAAVTEEPAARARFLEVHPYAAQYVDYADFAVWRIDVVTAQYVGGFAAAAALDPAALRHRIIAADGGL